MKTAFYAPFSLRERRGNSIRLLLQAEGFLKNGYSDFTVYSLEPGGQYAFPQHKVGENFLFKPFPLGQKIKHISAEIVHTHHYFGAMVLQQPFILDMPSYMSLQTPTVYRHAGRFPKRQIMRTVFNPFFQRPIETRMVRAAAHVIVASESIRGDLLKYIPGLDPAKISVITNPVKVEDYAPSACADLVIGVSASDFRDPMDSTSLAAALEIARRTGWRMKISGRTDEAQRAAMSAINNVEYLGVIDHRAYREEFLTGISVFLVPYVGFWDFGGSKFKLLEAGAASLPVVTTANGAIGFEPLDAVSVADTVGGMIAALEELSDDNTRRARGKALRDIIVRDYHYVTEAKKILDIYRKVTAS